LHSENINVALAFSMLSSVANFEEAPKEEPTFENMQELMRAKWNIVYDVSNKEIHFLTQSDKNIRTIQLREFDFNGNTTAQIFDIQSKFVGNINDKFIPYTYELNRNLIDRYFDQVPFLKNLSDEIRELTARYPEKTFFIGE
jgi:hypothetical protein